MTTALDERGRHRTLSTPEQVRALAVVLRDEFGTPFRFHDAETGRPAPCPENDAPGDASVADPDAVREAAADGRARVRVSRGGRYQLLMPLPQGDAPSLVAVGYVAALTQAPSESAQERARMEKWLLSVQDRVRLAISHRTRRREEAAHETQGGAAWEAVLAVEQLMRGVRIHKDPARDRVRILRLAVDVLKVGTVIWVPSQSDGSIQIEGERLLSPWDCSQLAGMLVHGRDWEKAGFVMVNQPGEGGWSDRFPGVHNLIAMPVTDKTTVGWLIAVNRTGDGPFRRTDAAVLAAFTASLGMQVRSSQRYHQLKVLLVGLTRSLTAAIDAKDSYTFGHSERVARVAVELGRELGLQEDELSDIYLGGLLHDIGKIGVSDAVLGKRDALTPEEMEHIRQHVKIGFRILADLKPIAHLLPGVLYHHEQYNGSGYPEGLKGEAIPFLARILAVADSYDAMSTSRPYRTAMPFQKVERILAEGAGEQWDGKVIDAFFRCREKIHMIRQRGVGESLCTALDGALRNGRALGDLSSLRVSHGLNKAPDLG